MLCPGVIAVTPVHDRHSLSPANALACAATARPLTAPNRLVDQPPWHGAGGRPPRSNSVDVAALRRPHHWRHGCTPKYRVNLLSRSNSPKIWFADESASMGGQAEILAKTHFRGNLFFGIIFGWFNQSQGASEHVHCWTAHACVHVALQRIESF